MPVHIANEHLRFAAMGAALLMPIYFSIEVFQLYYFREKRTAWHLGLMSAYFVGAFLLYALVLNSKQRLFLGGNTLVLLCVFYAGHVYNLFKNR